MSQTMADIPGLADDFTLPDEVRQDWRLREQLGQGPVVIVFYRGHWCPYCRRYLTKLQANVDRFSELGVKLVAISPEPPDTARRFRDQCRLDFPLLSDASGDIIDRYRVRNTLTSGGTLMPHPAVFIVDEQGLIRYRSIDRNYKKRTTMRTIFKELEKVVGRAPNQPATD